MLLYIGRDVHNYCWFVKYAIPANQWGLFDRQVFTSQNIMHSRSLTWKSYAPSNRNFSITKKLSQLDSLFFFFGQVNYYNFSFTLILKSNIKNIYSTGKNMYKLIIPNLHLIAPILHILMKILIWFFFLT